MLVIGPKKDGKGQLFSECLIDVLDFQKNKVLPYNLKSHKIKALYNDLNIFICIIIILSIEKCLYFDIFTIF